MNMDRKAEEWLYRLLERFGHNSHSHLYFMGDKKLFWDADHEAVIAYRSLGRRNIVLGDPVGNPETAGRLILQFMAYCRKQARIPVFYQAKSRYLPLFSSLGLQKTKIGEEAEIDLSRFHMQGKPWLKLRNRVNKFQREGYRIQILFPPYAAETINRLQEISEEWLSGRREKSFSVGSFAPDYISRFPIGLLIGPDGRYEAFVSINGDSLPASEDASDHLPSRKITVDLMRYGSTCPQGTMDFLFASLFLWAKKAGYDTCSLGVAPLANMDHLLFVRLLAKYGSRVYNFKGLYAFKNKFAPNWDDVYLVCPPQGMPVTIASLAYMINTPPSPLVTERDKIS